jgi:transcriptional regulator with XRE-family HTH domain
MGSRVTPLRAKLLKTFSKRLRKARLQAGFRSAQKFAEHLNIEPPGYRAYERGQAFPNLDLLTQICVRLGVTPNYLLDVTPNDSLEHAPMAEGSSESAPDDRPTTLAVFPQPRPGTLSCAEVTRRAGKDQASPIGETDALGSRETFTFDVCDASMEPGFAVGDRVIVDPTVKPGPDEYVLCIIDKTGKTTFRQYKPRGFTDGIAAFDLVPCNPEFPTVTVNARNPGQIRGVAVEHLRRLKR